MSCLDFKEYYIALAIGMALVFVAYIIYCLIEIDDIIDEKG
jgi:hypothetical protein